MSAQKYVTPELVFGLAQWARTKPTLRRLWPYGSRVRGTCRPDSDLDIAFEIDLMQKEAEKAQWHEVEHGKWVSELSTISALAVHLESYAIVTQAVVEHGVLVYERGTQCSRN